MKHFESSGTWFPADDSSNTVQGTLHFDGEGLNLRLFGSFREGWSAGADRYPTIHGIVDENPYGTFVTLVDCLRKQSRFSSVGLSSETIRCGRAVIGATHLPDGLSHFELLEVRFSHLNDWVGQTGIKFDLVGANGFSASYSRPELLSFPFGDKTLSLGSTVKSTHEKHRAILDEETVIVVEPIGEHSLKELGGDRIQILQNLLSFATDTPNEVEGITYHGTENDQGLHSEYHLVYNPIFRLKEDKKPLHSSDMLFTFTDAQSQGLNIFQSWLDFTERNPSFCTVYFANLYAEPRYLNDRFATLMRAFTLLVSRMADVSERTNLFLGDVEEAAKLRFNDGERAFLDHIMPNGTEIEMPFHLLQMLALNEHIMTFSTDDLPGFVRSVYDTLGFFQRRTDGTRPHIQGEKLLYTMLKIRMLVQIVVLKELGFGEDVVKSLAMRNNKFGFLRTF